MMMLMKLIEDRYEKYIFTAIVPSLQTFSLLYEFNLIKMSLFILID